MSLHVVDVLIIAAYVAATITIGIWFSRRASRSIRNYFLGGNRIPWYVLGVSDASGMFDVSGTMWMVYLLSVYGLKSIWIPYGHDIEMSWLLLEAAAAVGDRELEERVRHAALRLARGARARSGPRARRRVLRASRRPARHGQGVVAADRGDRRLPRRVSAVRRRPLRGGGACDTTAARVWR